MQDKVHVLKVPAKEAEHDAPSLLQALSYLEEEPEKAKEMGLAGARLVEEALAVDSNERCNFCTLVYMLLSRMSHHAAFCEGLQDVSTLHCSAEGQMQVSLASQN